MSIENEADLSRQQVVKFVNLLFDNIVGVKERFARIKEVSDLPDDLYGEIVLTATCNVLRYFVVSHLAPFARAEVLKSIYNSINDSLAVEPDHAMTQAEFEAKKAAEAEREKLGIVANEEPEVMTPN